jgi:hypothetical protein
MSQFEVFKSFYTYSEALTMFEFLEQEGIPCKIESMKPIADKVFVGDGMEMETLLKIPSDCFSKANRIIDKKITEQISQLEDDYYLFTFTDMELMEIIRQPYEWSNQDVIVARHLLNQRGYDISEKLVEITKAKKLSELAQPEKISTKWIITGYAASLFGIFGLVFGLYLLNSKKLLPDGNKVLVYEQRARFHAHNIIIISSIMIFILLVDLFTGRLHQY